MCSVLMAGLKPVIYVQCLMAGLKPVISDLIFLIIRGSGESHTQNDVL